MKYCLSILAFLAFTFQADAEEAIRKESITFQGNQRTFYLFVPDGVGGSR